MAIFSVGNHKEQGVYNVPTDGVDSMSIEWVSGDCSITPYDGNSIKITEFARRDLAEREKLVLDVSDSKVKISYCKRRISWRMPEKKLEVLIPRGLSEGLDKLFVSMVSGDVFITDISAYELDIESVSADVRISGLFDSVDLESVSGDMAFTGVAASNLSAQSVSGDTRVTIPDDGKTTVRHSSVSGNFSSELPVIVTQKNARLEFSTVSGDIKIFALD
ncbi:MAG: DUF4097 domain-containing protein [Oscillospiraceae bacterium]|nr:DUF4097 domain-containing protein [Oscillospiraceae bacterium]